MNKPPNATSTSPNAKPPSAKKPSTKNSKLFPEDVARGITHYNDQGRPCDDLGPLATNWDEIGARVRKKFGITPEESARRTKLFNEFCNPDGTLKTPAPHSPIPHLHGPSTP